MDVIHEARYARFKLVKENLQSQEIRDLSEQYEKKPSATAANSNR